MEDLTMSEVLKDPLIRQVLRADRVTLGDFAKLLEEAASRRSRNFCVAGALPERDRASAGTQG
ncbi:hypothetical protein [Rhizobium sp. 1399]|uniref:hypothetical protein n=1 Tax=Rhizobium sp. 1399 TaxID=2817758 RepID=UPI002864C56E|nr:hypothetical protein [Rhizobium sp. 1399]MDR6671270.1 hypothetical protein [Rhizobium sp. 1399]